MEGFPFSLFVWLAEILLFAPLTDASSLVCFFSFGISVLFSSVQLRIFHDRNLRTVTERIPQILAENRFSKNKMHVPYRV